MQKDARVDLTMKVIQPLPGRVKKCRRDIAAALDWLDLYIERQKKKKTLRSKSTAETIDEIANATVALRRAIAKLPLELSNGWADVVLALDRSDQLCASIPTKLPRAPKRDESHKRVAAEMAWLLLRRYGDLPKTTKGSKWEFVTAILLYGKDLSSAGLRQRARQLTNQIKATRNTLGREDIEFADWVAGLEPGSGR